MEGYDLKDQMTGGVKWAGADQIASYILQLFVWATLAWLLPPDNFVALGIAVAFSNAILIFSELGMSTVLIQKKDVTDLVMDYLPNENGKGRAVEYSNIIDDVLK